MGSIDDSPVVILIGLTQNGKSSVIKSLLKYAGDHERAAAVRQGNNNLSETKDVSGYPIEVPFKEHYLRNMETGEKVEHIDEDVDSEDLELGETILGENFRFRLLDTPGLSDSRASRPQDGEYEVKTGNMEDERHKLKVLSALSKIGRVNSVCFVVKSGQPFGWDFQKHISDYVRIFRLSALADKIHFHVLHTQIDVDYRFKTVDERSQFEEGFEANNDDREQVEDGKGKEELWMGHRARAFEEVTRIKATHHWMDNQPSKYDLLAQHFSKAAIANLVQSLSNDLSIPCPDLRYPKGQLHQLHDKDILAAYNKVIFHLETEKTQLNAEITQLRHDLISKISRRNANQEEISKLDPKIHQLDTTELVEIGKETRQKDWVFFGAWNPRLCFRIETSSIIRRIERDPENHPGGFWEVVSSTDDHYYADYQAYDMNNAWASVVLKGYRCDVDREEIGRLKRRREGFEGEVRRMNELIGPIEEEIRLKDFRVMEVNVDIKKLEMEKKVVDGDSFSLQSFRENAKLFLTGGLYATCQAYGLAASVSKTKLPIHDVDNPLALSELQELKRKQYEVWVDSKKILDRMKEELERKSDSKRKLEVLCEKIRGTREVIEAKIQAAVSPDIQMPPENMRDAEFYESLELADAFEKLQVRCQENNADLGSTLIRYHGYLMGIGRRTVQSLNDVIASLNISAFRHDEYKTIVRKHFIHHKAALKILEIFETEEIFMAAFIVLMKGIERRMSNLLYHELVIYLGEELP